MPDVNASPVYVYVTSALAGVASATASNTHNVGIKTLVRSLTVSISISARLVSPWDKRLC